LILGDREVQLKSQKKDQPLQDAKWVVLIAKGFETEKEARVFGEQLRQSVELAALSTLVGVDVGRDTPTSWANEEWYRAKGLIEPHQRLLNNIHGLMIVPDDDNSLIILVEGTGTVTSDPVQFANAIQDAMVKNNSLARERLAAASLLNMAIMSQEPLACAALAFSAVEALGQDEEWSEKQKAKIEQLARDLESESSEGDDEKIEIVEALRRSLHRIGLRQAVMGVLDRLELGEMRGEWDRLYKIRSGIFHGTKVLSAGDMSQFSNKALRLCGKIILTYFRQQGMHVPTISERNFGEPN
jgi:hypothetical protein